MVNSGSIDSNGIVRAASNVVRKVISIATVAATPVPPTETPTTVPTATLIPPTPTPAATATQKDEIKMLGEWAGESTRLLFVNNTKGTATISLFLSEGSNGKGYWGYIPVPVLAKNQSVAISAPKQGYYYVFAWMNDKDKKYSIQGSFGTNNPDKHEIHLSANGVKVIGP